MTDHETVNGNVKLGDVDRVFVGVPEVYSTEQTARGHALALAAREIRFRKGEDADETGEILATADRYAKFILTGSIG